VFINSKFACVLSFFFPFLSPTNMYKSTHLQDIPMSSEEREAQKLATLTTCKFKQLTISYVITGHDSEQKTTSEEVLLIGSMV
jgi:hypothetical protein